MVACMPACASFSRYCFHRFEIISSIKSHLSSSRSRSRKEKLSEPQSTATAPAGSLIEGPIRHGDKYWRIKNPFSNGSGRDDAPPQITMNKQQSRVLQTGDFDVFDNSRDPLALADNKTRRASLELKEPCFDEEKRAPYDMV
jgi:hypothetical protein